jgi:hypothetical protein
MTGSGDATGSSMTDEPASPGATQQTGSLSRRMMLTAAVWISILLIAGGVGLERTLTGLITRSFDDQLGYMMTGMVGSAELGPDGEVFFNRPLGDQRFLEPNSCIGRSPRKATRISPRVRCGTAASRSTRITSTPARTSTTARSSPASRCG